ncbi:MAG: tRNA pseudouridine(38-40) synthase TruA [Proteobacteria bacterium]|nr:tRNA pseudouridine(38-40) synthase TruA [Pseudomonadota bacterium]
MRNIRLTIAYDGSAYHGWQYQPRQPTVQGAIEACLQQLTQQPCRVRAAGRTDAGVHALGQLASFTSETALSCAALRRGLNALLAPDIVIRGVEDVDLTFDARRDNLGKHYRYAIHNARRLEAPLTGHAWHLRHELDATAMARAAWSLVGHHDFSAFRAADCDRLDTHRTISRASIARGDGPELLLDIEGTAFLKNMVRIIAGTLVEVGCGRMPPARIGELLHQGDRRRAGPTAPAHGLTLVKVHLG